MRALTAIAVVGIALALTACAAAPTAGAPASAASASGARSTPGGRSGQGFPGVTGDVVSANGSTFSVQVPGQSGPYTTVELTSSTQILKQAAGTLASAPVGTSISATGSEANGVFTATQLRVLGQAGQGGTRPGGPQAAGTPRANGTPRTGGGQRQGGFGQGSGGSNLFGTVEQVSADGLTVKAADGTSTQVHLAPNAQITVEAEGTAADIAPGVRVFVVGDEQNGKVSATRVQIIPAAPQG